MGDKIVSIDQRSPDQSLSTTISEGWKTGKSEDQGKLRMVSNYLINDCTPIVIVEGL
jgi:hypothetical protein